MVILYLRYTGLETSLERIKLTLEVSLSTYLRPRIVLLISPRDGKFIYKNNLCPTLISLLKVRRISSSLRYLLSSFSPRSLLPSYNWTLARALITSKSLRLIFFSAHQTLYFNSKHISFKVGLQYIWLSTKFAKNSLWRCLRILFCPQDPIFFLVCCVSFFLKSFMYSFTWLKLKSFELVIISIGTLWSKYSLTTLTCMKGTSWVGFETGSIFLCSNLSLLEVGSAYTRLVQVDK